MMATTAAEKFLRLNSATVCNSAVLEFLTALYVPWLGQHSNPGEDLHNALRVISDTTCVRLWASDCGNELVSRLDTRLFRRGDVRVGSLHLRLG